MKGLMVTDEEVQPITPAQSRVISRLQFMDQFTDDELAALFAAAKTVTQIEVFVEKVKAAEDINLSDSRTIEGVQALELSGLLGVGRANEILGIE